MTRSIALIFRDGFFCKDGRGWFASSSGRGYGLDWPWPSTIRGALRTAWGRAEEDRTNTRFEASDWLTRTSSIQINRMLALRREHGTQWKPEHVCWPVPRDVVSVGDVDSKKDRFLPLDPTPPVLPTIGSEEDEAREALWTPVVGSSEKPNPLPAWWCNQRMVDWLIEPSAGCGETRPLRMLRRPQTHVGIRGEQLTADDGVLFSHEVVETLEPKAEWAIAIEAALPTDLPVKWVMIGSDARPARVESLPQGLFDVPEPLCTAFGKGSRGLRIVIVTPTLFRNGWLPDGLDRCGHEYRGTLPDVGEVVLRAAFVPRPMHVSGWEMISRGSGKAVGAPKNTDRMVSTGAVYFFERADGRPFVEADARALWLSALGSRAEEGFGRVVPGVWSPTRSNP